MLWLLARAIATGTSLWGKYPVHYQGPVLFLNGEDPQFEMRRRKHKLSIGNDLPIYFLHFSGLMLDRPSDVETILEFIEEIQPVLTIFDPLIRFHRQEESSSSGMAPVMAALRRIVNAGTTGMFSHHHGKGESALNNRSRGSSDIQAGVDMEFSIVRRNRDLIFQSVKSRMMPVPPIKITIEEKDEEGPIEFLASENDYQVDEDIEAAIEDVLSSRRAVFKEVWKYLKSEGFMVGDNKLRGLLRAIPGVVHDVLQPSGAYQYRYEP